MIIYHGNRKNRLLFMMWLRHPVHPDACTVLTVASEQARQL
jgi:hypothetical protein